LYFLVYTITVLLSCAGLIHGQYGSIEPNDEIAHLLKMIRSGLIITITIADLTAILTQFLASIKSELQSADWEGLSAAILETSEEIMRIQDEMISLAGMILGLEKELNYDAEAMSAGSPGRRKLCRPGRGQPGLGRAGAAADCPTGVIGGKPPGSS
jgi:hypothetical protein